MIELKDIHFSYSASSQVSHPVFEGFGMCLREGERVALVGANGSGKSTLMRLIMGLSSPQKGQIDLFGAPCTKEEEFVRARRRMGFVFQDTDDQLFSPTVDEDIAFGPLNLGRTHKEAHEDVMEICEMLGISDIRREVTHKLSGGQKRLVALATAAAMRPEVLLLDEPTSGLDAKGMETLVSYLNNHTKTLLIASHDRDFLKEVTSSTLCLQHTKT